MRRPGSSSPTALDLVEQAVHLLRRTPPADFLVWLLGAGPFTAALLFFWAEMSRAPLAEHRLLGSAWGLAALYVWLKTCQAVFAARLLDRASAGAETPWSISRWSRVLLTQAVLQPAGLFLLPIALVLTVPFAWVFALFQNLGVLADRSEGRPGSLLHRGWQQAVVWPGQNHALLSLLSVAWLVVSLNAGIALYTFPHLLKLLLGVESRLTLSPATVLNTTFLAVACALGTLAMDPLVKAAYALRCFHGLSRRTGDDLRASLQRIRQLGPVTVLGLLLWAGQVPVLAADAGKTPLDGRSPDASELGRALDEVLDRPEFAWRTPRDWQLGRIDPDASWLERQVRNLGRQLDRLSDALGAPFRRLRQWLDRIFGPAPGTPTLPGKLSLNMAGIVEFLLWLLVVVGVGVLVWFGVRIFRTGRRGPAAAPVVPSMPDLRAEFVAADQLPEDGWLALAGRLLEEGDQRLAVRAYYLAALAHLARREFIRLAKFKSNLDYSGELRRRARARPEVAELFADAVRDFDRVWYGEHAVTTDGVVAFAARVEELRRA